MRCFDIVCVCVCVYQRKTKDIYIADGMSEKNAHSPYEIRTCHSGIRAHPFRLYYESRHTSRQFEQTLQTLTHQLHRETQACMATHSNSYLRDRDGHQASARTSAESDKACQRRTKDRADSMSEKSACSSRGDSNLYLCVRARVHTRFTHACVLHYM